MKYAVLGAKGQLGQAFLRVLGPDAVGLTRAEADLTQPQGMRAALQALRPDVVVNCTAYNGVDQAESDPVPAFAVNTWGVRDLARSCRDLGCVLVHYSTNYVFGLDAQRHVAYREDDTPGPISVYGTSKLAGEYLVRAECGKHFVIRTCALFGAVRAGSARRSFVELMLHLARQGQPIRVVDDQTCSPTRTDDLVAATLELLGTGAYGLYHLTSAGACGWHDLARTVFELSGVKADLKAVSSAEFGARARRPAYSVLANDAYLRLGLRPIRPWREALVTYLREPLEINSVRASSAC